MVECIPLGFYGNDSDDEISVNGSSLYYGKIINNLTSAEFNNSVRDYEDVFWENQDYERIERIIYTYVVTTICIFGILGNLLNLVVLTRKSLSKTMDRMEKSAHVGLITMAVSDMFFCFSILPHAWVPWKQFMFASRSFALYYDIYSPGVINIFIMSSTWLTVTIAVSRYLAIVHPLRARDVIGMTFARCSMVITFAFCILFNLPRFWNEYVEVIDCEGGHTVFFKERGFMMKSKTFQTVYMWLYFVFAIFIPLLCLIYCNAYLIRALRHSVRMRQQYQPTSSAVKESTHRITLTLVIIIIMYVILVAPLEIMAFLKEMVIVASDITPTYNLVLAIFNTLQACNFAFNFILYCAINVHFRQTVISIFCACKKKEKFNANSGWYESVSATTQV